MGDGKHIRRCAFDRHRNRRKLNSCTIKKGYCCLTWFVWFFDSGEEQTCIVFLLFSFLVYIIRLGQWKFFVTYRRSFVPPRLLGREALCISGSPVLVRSFGRPLGPLEWRWVALTPGHCECLHSGRRDEVLCFRPYFWSMPANLIEKMKLFLEKTSIWCKN